MKVEDRLDAFLGKRPTLGANAFVAPSASVVGDVCIGRESSVWYGAVLRGDVHHIRIGSRTNIQDRSVLHVTRDRFPCLVGDEVTVTGRRKLFSGKYHTRYSWSWDVAPDGRFLMIARGPQSVPDRINVVLNWSADLERLLD